MLLLSLCSRAARVPVREGERRANVHFGTGFTVAVMVLAWHPSEHPRKTSRPCTLYSPTGWGPDAAGEGDEKSLKCLSGNTAKLPEDVPGAAAGCRCRLRSQELRKLSSAGAGHWENHLREPDARGSHVLEEPGVGNPPDQELSTRERGLQEASKGHPRTRRTLPPPGSCQHSADRDSIF